MTNDDLESPGDRLRSARATAGYSSAAEAARAFGWPEASYRHHENGTRGFAINQASLYGKAFKVSPSWLVGWSREPSRHLIEDFRDGLLGTDRELTGADVADELAKNFRITFVDRFKLSNLGLSDGTTGTDPDKFYIFDSQLLNSISPSERPYIAAVVIDIPIEAAGIPQGAVILVDRASRHITRQNMLWLYFYNGIPGLSRLWAHSDGDFELIDAGRVRLSSSDVTMWGQAIWSGHQL